MNVTPQTGKLRLDRLLGNTGHESDSESFYEFSRKRRIGVCCV